MSKPVYKLYLVKPRLEAVMLPAEQQQSLNGKTTEILAQVGGKSLIDGEIWSDEQYQYFGVEQFPNWQALREQNRRLRDMNLFQYMESETFMGVEDPENPTLQEPLSIAEGPEGPFFLIYVSRFHSEYEVTEEVMKEAEKLNQLTKELGFRDIIYANARIGNEAWTAFGVQLVPSMEALEKKQAAQDKVKWWKYIEARTYLGSATGGELIKPGGN
jgi:hypothetical protein